MLRDAVSACTRSPQSSVQTAPTGADGARRSDRVNMGATEEGDRQGPITHLVIARACDGDPDGPNAEARIGHAGEPSPETLADYTLNVANMFKQAFGEEPARVAVAVLPWVAELDDDGPEVPRKPGAFRRASPKSAARARPGALAEAYGDDEPMFPLPTMQEFGGLCGAKPISDDPEGGDGDGQ
jgi:hypothetical protein